MTNFTRDICLILMLTILLTACSGVELPAATALPPMVTLTPAPTQTPTITPTLAPREMAISELLEDCEELATSKVPVILAGTIFLPDETIYGYVGWYGVDLISSARVRALLNLGTGPNQMEDLPQYFHEQDLLIHAADSRLIRHGHAVTVTGWANYRADNEERRCEVYVDSVISNMPATVLEPVDVTIGELLDGNEVNDCDDLEFSRQFVRLTGAVRLDDYTSKCQLGMCRITFADDTGEAFVYLLEGEGVNRMKSLPEAFSGLDLVIKDKQGVTVNNRALSLVGVTRQGDGVACEMIVYEVEAND